MIGFGLGGGGRAWVLVASIATAVACGNTTDGPPGSSSAGASSVGDTQTPDEFIQQFASNFCRSIADCCTRQGFATTDCETTLVDQLGPELRLSTSNPKIRFNAAAASACIDAYSVALRACTDQALFAKLDDACDPLLEGTVALGGQCGKSAECATPAGAAVSCDSGVCVVAQQPSNVLSAPHRNLGETCASTCDDRSPREISCSGEGNADRNLGACWLQDGLVCASGTCVAAPKAGEACASSGLCARGTHCVSDVCVDSLSTGPCTQDSACLSPSICDDTLRMCISLKANGEACNASDECLGRQCEEHQCRTWSVARTASCLGVLDD